jgi:hypothetical protein
MMNPVLKKILMHNTADIEAIIAKVGIGTLLSLMPHVINILESVQQAQSGETK